MDVGMVSQVAGPGLQHTQEANLTTDKARVVGQFLQSGCRGLKQQVIEQALLLAGQGAQSLRQGESDHKVRDGQQQGLLFLQPLLPRFVLALGTVAVFAGVVAVAGLGALITGVHVAAQGLGPALFNGLHRF